MSHVLSYSAALVLFVFAVTNGAAVAWDAAATIASLVVSVVLGIGFFFWESYIPEEHAAVYIHSLPVHHTPSDCVYQPSKDVEVRELHDNRHPGPAAPHVVGICAAPIFMVLPKCAWMVDHLYCSTLVSV